MKVTYVPDISTWKHSCECYQCKSKLDIVGDDLLYKTEKRYSSNDDWGGGSWTEAVYYVICPMCNNQIQVNSSSTKMPYLLMHKVQERTKSKK